eukprot:TRINITY_DN15721_c0_g1_i1.p1 TRINITY_DN15721_c0_g1~~TRINITY_DN15721_c0_g1_i1.p1  ORF type:complete len:130 (+),score=29.98 TRINITY_DN15721_c0_g1_i1:109-498(+)
MENILAGNFYTCTFTEESHDRFELQWSASDVPGVTLHVQVSDDGSSATITCAGSDQLVGTFSCVYRDEQTTELQGAVNADVLGSVRGMCGEEVCVTAGDPMRLHIAVCGSGVPYLWARRGELVPGAVSK